MTKIDFSPKEKEILSILYAANKPLNTNEIARRLNNSYGTALKYLENLFCKNVLECGKKGNANFWWINVNYGKVD